MSQPTVLEQIKTLELERAELWIKADRFTSTELARLVAIGEGLNVLWDMRRREQAGSILIELDEAQRGPKIPASSRKGRSPIIRLFCNRCAKVETFTPIQPSMYSAYHLAYGCRSCGYETEVERKAI